jgi:signal transduction histidine kinase
MKISTRLSLRFSFIANAIFIGFGISVYLFASNHRKNEFQERLEDRVLIFEKIFLEKGAYTSLEFNKIKDQYSNTLHKQTEEVIEIDGDIRPAFKFNYSKAIREEVLENETCYFEEHETQGYSKLFHVNGKKYIVIVTAVDQTGIQNLSYLKYRIILLILIGIPLFLIGSFTITKKALLPLTKKIHHANAITASNLHQRLKVFNPEDEIGELAIAFNKLLDRLELAFNAHKSFISNASHEIRNPLTAIMGEAEVALSKSRNPEEYAESLRAILKESEMLSSTVNNLLQLSKVIANEEGVRFEIIEFETFLIEVKTSFDFVNTKNKIVLVQEYKDNKLSILGNKNLLKSAIFNLLDNACKFSDNGEVTVTSSQKNNFLKLAIRDNGKGISTEDLMNIRAPFYRGENALNIKGSGIGLSLTDKIINLHNGELHIESALGSGTEVEILLPLT